MAERRVRLLAVNADLASVAAAGALLPVDVWSARTLSEGLRLTVATRPRVVFFDTDRLAGNAVSFINAALTSAPGCQLLIRTPDDPAAVAALGLTGRTWWLRPTPDVLSVVVFMADLLALGSDGLVTAMPHSPTIRRACEYLVRHYPDRFTVDALVEATGLSRSHLTNLFRKETGRTMRECLARIRVEVAKYLVASREDSLAEIAGRTGFTDTSHLSRVFLRQTGLRPSAYGRLVNQPPLEWIGSGPVGAR